MVDLRSTYIDGMSGMPNTATQPILKPFTHISITKFLAYVQSFIAKLTTVNYSEFTIYIARSVSEVIGDSTVLHQSLLTYLHVFSISELTKQ